MNKTLLTLLMAMVSIAGMAAERSFTISFGAENVSTNSLTNDDFLSAVTKGASYISEVTSTISVFPEKDCIKLSSSKTDGGFNIHLTDAASIRAKRIEVTACRYDNDRDADAGLYINSEPLDIPSTEPETYTVDIVARPRPVLTNLIVKAEHRVYIYSITVVYDSEDGDVPGETERVATPAFIPGSGTLAKGSSIEITCATPDAVIRYTLDGSAPDITSAVYEAPIAIEEDIILQATAYRDGMEPSETAFATYRVVDADPTLVYAFDFANPETLTPAVQAPGQKESVLLDGRTFTNGEAAVSFKASESGNTHVRLYGSYDAGCDLRIYDGEELTVRTLNTGYRIDEIAFEISFSGTSDVNFNASAGSYEWLDNTWTSGDESVSEVTLTSIEQSRISKMTVTLAKTTTAVSSIEVENSVSPVYFDLTGRRLNAAPSVPGIYIRLSGTTATKITIP